MGWNPVRLQNEPPGTPSKPTMTLMLSQRDRNHRPVKALNGVKCCSRISIFMSSWSAGCALRATLDLLGGYLNAWELH